MFYWKLIIISNRILFPVKKSFFLAKHPLGRQVCGSTKDEAETRKKQNRRVEKDDMKLFT